MTMTKPSTKRRSPIKNPPRRVPATSLRRQYLDLFPRFMIPLTTFVVITAVAIIEAIRSVVNLAPQPWLFMAAMIPATIWLRLEYRRAMRQIDRLELAIQGELTVADLLSDLASDGYRAFHDLEFPAANGGTFNVDHVLIGPAGIFAIETKTRSKRQNSGFDATIDYDGQRILIDGLTPDRDPIAQARASADAICKLIRDHTGRDIYVRGVVLFPGWQVKPKSGAAVWVLNPAMLQGWLSAEERYGDTPLLPEHINAFAHAIEKHQQAPMSR